MQLRLPLVFLCIVSCAFSAERPNVPAIRLNPVALEFAQQLIREGRVFSMEKAHGPVIGPLRARKTSSFGCTALANTRNGILGLTADTEKKQKRITNSVWRFHGTSPLWPTRGQAARMNMAMPRSKLLLTSY